MLSLFLRDMRRIKAALCGLIDSDGPHWADNFETIVVLKKVDFSDRDLFLGTVLILVESGEHIKAKAVVRNTISDVALRPWFLQVVLFIVFPFQLVYSLYKKATAS